MISTFFPEQEQLFRERTGKDFSFFYTKYYPKLIYYTARMCNDQQKAEDISTDSFLIAFEKIDKYEKEKSQFSTWLFTIAKNLMLQDPAPKKPKPKKPEQLIAHNPTIVIGNVKT